MKSIQPTTRRKRPTHLHVLTGWPRAARRDPRDLADRLKRVVGCLLSKHLGATGQKWFSRGSDEKRVNNRRHLTHLLEEYLPGHRAQGGVVVITDKGQAILAKR